MDNISREDKLNFLIDISKGHLKPGTDWDTVYKYYYGKRGLSVYGSAMNVAYGTLSRTLGGIKDFANKKPMYKEANEYLENRLREIAVSSQEEFDAWHEETADEIKRIYAEYGWTLNYGQIQKWINMSMKHLAIAGMENIAKVYEFCHIPVDSYIIDGVRNKLFPQEFWDIDYTFGQKGYIAWSNIDSYDVYLKFQKDFRERCGGVAPLDKEFHFWLDAKEDKNNG